MFLLIRSLIFNAVIIIIIFITVIITYIYNSFHLLDYIFIVFIMINNQNKVIYTLVTH